VRPIVERQADRARAPGHPGQEQPAGQRPREGGFEQPLDAERQLAGTGITPLFPLWGTPADTPPLAQAMLASGLSAVITCVDPKQISESFTGRAFDASLLAELPPSADPCGERGEFHTFCYAGPMFQRPLPVRVGEVLCRDSFWFADVLHDA